MTLKTSFFNKSLFKSDMKRFWWIGLLEALALLALVTVPLYNKCLRMAENEHLYYRGLSPTWMAGGVVIPLIFAVSVATLLFTYMHGSASVSAYHSLPLKRGCIYFTKLVSGAFLTIIPILINTVILVLIIGNPLFSDFFSYIDIVKWVIAGIMYSAVVFSLTAIVNMMTGNPIGTVVFTVGFAVLPVILAEAFNAMMIGEVYGYVRYSGDFFAYLYAAENVLLTPTGMLTYIIMTILFSVGGYLLYRLRKLEAHGEVITFVWLKPVFIGIISILASFFSYVYFGEILQKDGILYILPLGALGTVIAWMISRKSLSLRGVIKPVMIYLAAALCFCGIVEFDLTGYERRVPDAEDVLWARIVNSESYYAYHYGYNEINYTHPGKISPDFTEKEDLENVIALHKHLTQNREPRLEQFYLPLEYKLKNGRTIVRRYYPSYKEDSEYLKPLYETPQIKAEFFSIIDGGEREITEVTVIDRRIASEGNAVQPDAVQAKKLIESLQADIAALPYEEFTINSGGSVNIHINYKNKYAYTNGIPEDFSTINLETHSDTYTIRPSYKNTVALLTEMGFYNLIPTSDEIEGATVSVWAQGVPVAAYKDIDIAPQTNEAATIINVTDPREIKTLYSMYDSMLDGKKFTDYNNCLNISISFRVRGTGHTFEVSCSYDPHKLPAEYLKYFEKLKTGM